jgi:hypothetical protein
LLRDGKEMMILLRAWLADCERRNERLEVQHEFVPRRVFRR